MQPDLFGFWRNLPLGTKVHPEDQPVFSRIGQGEGPGHGFQLNCLASPYSGPLKTAPVVFLYLSAGWEQQDSDEADTEVARARQWAQWQGDAPIPASAEHRSGWQWWASRAKAFGNLADHRDKIAFLNISAYHSKDFDDHALLTALPSCRLAVSWAQSVLFPEAEAGKRVVVCLRSAGCWGLKRGTRYGQSLFAPEVTRAGHMIRQGEAGVLAETIRAAADRMLRRSSSP